MVPTVDSHNADVTVFNKFTQKPFNSLRSIIGDRAMILLESAVAFVRSRLIDIRNTYRKKNKRNEYLTENMPHLF